MSYFPILVIYVDTNEKVVCQKPEDIVSGKAFKVLKTNYEDPRDRH